MKVNLGCGKRRVPGWVNVDRSPAVGPDVLLDLGLPLAEDLTRFLPFEDASVDCLNMRAVLEHLPREHVLDFVDDCWRVLRPGGALFLQVPSAGQHVWVDPTHESPFVDVEVPVPGTTRPWLWRTVDFFTAAQAERQNADYDQAAKFEIAWSHRLLFQAADSVIAKLEQRVGLTRREALWLYPSLVDALNYWLLKPGGEPEQWREWDAELAAVHPNGYAKHHGG